MFDGNHRTARRAVNLGTGRQRQRSQQQQHNNRGTAGTSAESMMLQSLIAPTAAIESNTARVLEETKRRREERRIHQQQNHAATTIQRYRRGYASRQRTLSTLIDPVIDQLFVVLKPQQQQQQVDNLVLALNKLTFQLNVRVLITKHPQQGQLCRYADVIVFVTESCTDDDDVSAKIQPTAPYTAQRIVQATLKWLLQRVDIEKDKEKAITILNFLILGRGRAIQQQDLHEHERILRWKRLGGGRGFLLLVQCFQQQQKRLQQQKELGLIIENVVPKSAIGQAFQGALSLTTTSGTITSSSGFTFSDIVIPLLPVILFLGTNNNTSTDKMDIDNSSAKATGISRDDDDKALLQQAVQNMVSQSPIVLLNNAITLYNQEMSQLQQSSTGSVLSRRRKILTNAIVQLVKYILLSRTSSSCGGISSSNADEMRTILVILAGKVVRGDDIQAIITVNKAPATSLVAQQQNQKNADDSDDEDDYEDGDEDTGALSEAKTVPISNRATSAVTGTTSKKHRKETVGSSHQRKSNTGSTINSNRSNFFTKQELQTVSKLDRLYSKEVYVKIQKSEELCLSLHRSNSGTVLLESMDLLAKTLANPDAILRWGRILLAEDNDDSDGTDNNQEDSVLLGQESYVTVLAMLLQLTTGLKSRQNYTSAFLTKLAFANDFVSLLWKYIQKSKHALQKRQQEQQQQPPPSATMTSFYLAVSVFCDLWAHSLIATKDDIFLQRYTTVGGSSSYLYQASDVIVQLRDLLYELYWSKPVQMHDFQCILPSTIAPDQMENEQHQWTTYHAARARLFLVGTKLWNSLYERWNRLVVFRAGHDDDNDNSSSSNTNQGKPKHVICEESRWWFPTMTSALAAGGGHYAGSFANSNNHRLRNSHSRSNRMMHQGMNDDDDAMSIDTSESDDSANGIHSSQTTINRREDPMSVADAESDALAEAFADPKMARILTCIPQSVPFDKRAKLFDSLLKADKRKAQVDEESTMHHAMLAMMRGEHDGDFMMGGREHVEIHRDQLYDDSMAQLNSKPPSKLKGRIQVSFINQHGAQEAGIDGGGVFKEFIDDLIKDAFSITDSEKCSTAKYHLFAVTPLQTLRVNTDIYETRQDLEVLLPHYEFLGRVLGKAVYESILVEPQFCLPFLNQLLGKNNSMEDLKNYDPEYYRNLNKLLQLSESELESLGLTFELTLGSTLSSSRSPSASGRQHKIRTIELLPGGSKKPVTKENVIQYIHLVAHQRLNVETSLPTRAFLRGFRDLIPASWVRLFSAYELQKLISGDDSIKGIDVQSFKIAMQYAAGYHPAQPVIEWFWEIVEEMTPVQQHKLLKFMTSCSRQPLLGFGSLEPAPCIQQIRLPDAMFVEPERVIIKNAPLPTSSTCMNLLKLPNYRWKELMRTKLLAAIESGAGFELT